AAISGPINVTTGALRIGGNAVWGEYFAGRIDEVRIYNRPLSVTEITTDMNTPILSGSSSDTTPPAVAITAPAAGAVITGLFKITATASDAGGIGGVQFKVDGLNVGAEDVSAPYEANWDTSALPNTSHSITALA